MNSSTKGSAPLALPPNVFNGEPASLTLLISHLGICPEYNRVTISLKDLDQPILLSGTQTTVSVGWKSSATVGSLSTSDLLTENPTPVPHINIYIISLNFLALSIATKQQLYPATLSLSKASPAVIKQRIDGITFLSKINCLHSSNSA